MIQKAKKKPVVIEFLRLDIHSFAEAYQWLGINVDLGMAQDGTFINIKTLEGTMQAQIGDCIIKGVNGEFYPCKPDIFEKTYELVDEPIK